MTEKTKPEWGNSMNMKGMRNMLTNMNESLDNMKKVYEAQRKQLQAIKKQVNNGRSPMGQ